MTTRTIDCLDCGESVPYGRLSCPTCGALLASVTGGRPAATSEPATSEPAEAVAADDVPTELAPLLPDDAEPVAEPWPQLEEPEPVLAGRPYHRVTVSDPAFGPLASPPGAYRPSSLSLSSAVPAGSGWASPRVAATIDAAADPSTTIARSRLGPLDPARFAEIAGWFVVVGATMSVLGFLLPWSDVVIGARGTGSYFDTWGLASPTHVLVLAATMLVLALGVVRTSVPVWIRSGVLPSLLGSLLIGLVWPYQVGPLGADVGVLVVALGGLAMVIGGVVATWATRHVEVEPAV